MERALRADQVGREHSPLRQVVARCDDQVEQAWVAGRGLHVYREGGASGVTAQGYASGHGRPAAADRDRGVRRETGREASERRRSTELEGGWQSAERIADGKQGERVSARAGERESLLLRARRPV